MTQPTCEQRVGAHWNDREDDLRRLLDAEEAGNEDGPEDLGPLGEYALNFDYCEPGTFRDQDEGYWRYQISWGGPSEEIRYFVSPGGTRPYRVEFWLLDWGDGARLNVTKDPTALRLWDWLSAFVECWDRATA